MDDFFRSRALTGSVDQYFPPDSTVLIDAKPNDLERWQSQDSAGSADAAYALGVHALQVGNCELAMECFKRAKARGSAEAALSYALLQSSLGAADEVALNLLNEADQAGSPGAAAILAHIYGSRGDDAAADAALNRARVRAAAGDERGSADAALLVASLTPDVSKRQEALYRADERGSSVAAFFNGVTAHARGDLLEAEEDYRRALQRSQPAAAVPLGAVLLAQGKPRAARKAWRIGRRAAIDTGDTELFSATQLLLVPPLRLWIRTHRLQTIVIGVAAILLVVTGHWQWSIVLAYAIGLALLARNRPLRDSYVSFPSEPPEADRLLDAKDLTLSIGISNQLLNRPVPRSARRLTTRDVVLWWISFLALCGFLVALMGWSAGILTWSNLVPLLSFAAALTLLLEAVHCLASASTGPAERLPPSDDPTNCVLHLKIEFRHHLFFKGKLGVRIQDPRVPAILDAMHAARPVRQPRLIHWITAGLTAASLSLLAALLALPLVAPARASTLREIGNLVEVGLTFWLMGLLSWRVAFAIVKQRPFWWLAIILYGSLAIIVAVIAAVLGVWTEPLPKVW